MITLIIKTCAESLSCSTHFRYLVSKKKEKKSKMLYRHLYSGDQLEKCVVGVNEALETTALPVLD